MMKSPDKLGQTVQIILPEVTDQTILARVDTGAQTSAIWATNIQKTSDGLRANFLGDSKKAIIFHEYKQVEVTSSNSLSEKRYKVKLLIVINNRRIKTWFTLTDRSQRSYPVLLGRNVLRGKFLVDVSRSV